MGQIRSWSRAYRLGVGRRTVATMLAGLAAFAGSFAVVVAWPAEAWTYGAVLAGIGVCLVVTEIWRLRCGPVEWYRVMIRGSAVAFESEEEYVLTGRAGVVPERFAWPKLVPPVYGVIAAALLARHSVMWFLYASTAVIGAAEAWLYPRGRRPVLVVRVPVGGKVARFFVVDG
jgi:hypothetical protein